MNRVRVFLLGLYECREQCGLTFNDDPNSLLSRAYDAGRYFGWRVLGIDEI